MGKKGVALGQGIMLNGGAFWLGGGGGGLGAWCVFGGIEIFSELIADANGVGDSLEEFVCFVGHGVGPEVEDNSQKRREQKLCRDGGFAWGGGLGLVIHMLPKLVARAVKANSGKLVGGGGSLKPHGENGGGAFEGWGGPLVLEFIGGGGKGDTDISVGVEGPEKVVFNGGG